ncbi:MAG TPA: hypothetical protein VMP01_07960, partial [Pirellulaceae bacterium]|nr:hypothetical protein [Pirellulaceae bacterium]
MPIPDFDADGLLPVGIYDCTLQELRDRFGTFQTSDLRCRLYERLEAFLREAKLSGVAKYVIVDGSFVTGKAVPNDIDLIVVVPEGHDFHADLQSLAYNVVSKAQVRRRYRFDVFVAADNSRDLADYL